MSQVVEQESLLSKTCSWVTAVFAWMCVILGAATLAGWMTNCVPLIQLRHGWAPIHPAATVGFILCGLSLLALFYRRYFPAMASGFLVFGFAAMTLFEYFFSISLKINQFFFAQEYIHLASFKQGLMPPNTAICFAVAGLALFISSFKIRSQSWLGISSAVVFSIALAAFSGYVVSVQAAYGWREFNPMAFQGACGFLFLGAGLFACAWRETNTKEIAVPSWLPFTIGAGTLTAVLCMVEILITNETLATNKDFQTHLPMVVLVLGVLMVSLITLTLHLSQKMWLRLLERHKAEIALSESEARSRQVIQTANDAFISMDSNGLITEWNQQAETTFGWPRESALGKDVAQFIIPPHYREAHLRGLHQFLETGKGPLLGKRVELSTLHRDGHEFPVELTIWATRTHEGTLFNAFVRDLTERKKVEAALKKSEEQLRQAQKMQAVGRLAGGVAHDFNNLLTTIIGYSDLMEGRLSAEDPLRKEVEEIRKAAERAAHLTQQLLAFGRKQAVSPKTLNLNTEIKELEKMLQRLLGEDIALEMDLDPNLNCVKADPSQIEQVFLNLAINARDAMPQGGKLFIQTKNVQLDEKDIHDLHDLTPGYYVAIRIEDTGIGMDSITQSQIFEPFFTTKGVGKGPGLGLPTVYGIVKQSGGGIAVKSDLGKGTTFCIYLPRALCDVEGRPERKGAPAVAPSHGTETILLVEDEESVRDLAKNFLEIHGYRVLSANDGEAALELSAQYPHPIHLLVSDVVMPKMNGPDLAKKMADLRPQMKVILISGYAQSAILHEDILARGYTFLPKPFTPAVLTRTVREVLDTQPLSA